MGGFVVVLVYELVLVVVVEARVGLAGRHVNPLQGCACTSSDSCVVFWQWRVRCWIPLQVVLQSDQLFHSVQTKVLKDTLCLLSLFH